MQGSQSRAVGHKQNIIGLQLDILRLQLHDLAQVHGNLIALSGVQIFSKDDGILRSSPCSSCRPPETASSAWSCGRRSFCIRKPPGSIYRAHDVNNAGAGNGNNITPDEGNIETRIAGFQNVGQIDRKGLRMPPWRRKVIRGPPARKRFRPGRVTITVVPASSAMPPACDSACSSVVWRSAWITIGVLDRADHRDGLAVLFLHRNADLGRGYQSIGLQ